MIALMTRRLLLVVALTAATSASAFAQSCNGADKVLQLKKKWVESIADRATLSVTMLVTHAKKGVNSISSGGDDGDIHYAADAAEVRLPFVAEIVNAKQPGQQAARQVMAAAATSQQTIPVTGAWRLWFEHPAAKQTQFKTNVVTGKYPTNPDHSFELHPISRVAQHDIRGSFIPIPGYTAYTAERAFPEYDACVLRGKASKTGITLTSKTVGFNYAEFDIVLMEKPQYNGTDGYLVLASIGDSPDEAPADGPHRMVFVDGAPYTTRIRNANQGDTFRVLGIPRVDLSVVLHLVQQHGLKEFAVPLPYEMIIVGVR